jgi:hypothetical protein
MELNFRSLPARPLEFISVSFPIGAQDTLLGPKQQSLAALETVPEKKARTPLNLSPKMPRRANTPLSVSALRDDRSTWPVDRPIDALPQMHPASHAPSDAAAAALVSAADDLKRTINAGKVIGFLSAALTAVVYLLTM